MYVLSAAAFAFVLPCLRTLYTYNDNTMMAQTIGIPTLQSWLEVFTWVDWNHSRTVGFVELKQGLSACNTPEGAPHPLRLCVAAVLISRLSRCSQLDAQHC